MSASARQQFTFCLEMLCRLGLLKVQRGENDDQFGLVLTPRGAALASDPAAVKQWIAVEGFDPAVMNTPQGQMVQRTLVTPARPLVHRLIFSLNVLVFLAGLVMAWDRNVVSSFLMPGMAVNPADPIYSILVRTGLLQRTDLAAGEGWRLITCGFVHLGLLHIVFNLYALRVLGIDNEWLWGSWRYLLLYLVALLGGSCAALLSAHAIAGASGALCGLLAAEIVWLLLYRRYLPRKLLRTQLRGLLISGVLIIGISLVPGVSALGHLGGAVVGGLCALLLHVQRFGGKVTSGLALLGLAALPVACLVGLDQVRRNDPTWQREERQRERDWSHKAQEREVQELRVELDQMRIGVLKEYRATHALLEKAPKQRDAEGVRAALTRVEKLQPRLEALTQHLRELPPFDTALFERLRAVGLAYFRLWSSFWEEARQCLDEERAWKDDAEQIRKLNTGRKLLEQVLEETK